MSVKRTVPTLIKVGIRGRTRHGKQLYRNQQKQSDKPSGDLVLRRLQSGPSGVGETWVSFDRHRFSEFASMVSEIHYDSFESIGIFDILNIANEIDVGSARESRAN